MPPKKGKSDDSPPKKRKALPYSLRIRCLHQDLDDGASTSSGAGSTSVQKKKTKSPVQNWRDELKAKNPKKAFGKYSNGQINTVNGTELIVQLRSKLSERGT